MTSLETMAAAIQIVLDKQWCTPLSTNPPTESAYIMARGLLAAGYVHQGWGRNELS